MKQYELSDILGMDDSGLRKIESGRTNPTVKTLIRIVNALDVEFVELFNFKDIKNLLSKNSVGLH